MSELDRAFDAMHARDLGQARAILATAAANGDRDAALIEVAMTANGSGAPPDWPRAVDLLRRAAENHGGEAAEHLRLIEAMSLDGEGYPLDCPDGEVLSQAPRVRVWRGLLTPAECAHVARAVGDILEPSRVADPRTGELIPHPIRTSSAAQIGPTRESLPIQAILKRLAAFTGTAPDQGEPLTVLHYAPGQEYRPHLDTLPRTNNQRVSTVLLYLNEGYAGGETRFDANGLTFAGRGGDALWFANTLASGAPDPASRHAGLPIRQGAKWMATRWIRERRFDVWKGPESES